MAPKTSKYYFPRRSDQKTKDNRRGSSCRKKRCGETRRSIEIQNLQEFQELQAFIRLKRQLIHNFFVCLVLYVFVFLTFSTYDNLKSSLEITVYHMFHMFLIWLLTDRLKISIAIICQSI